LSISFKDIQYNLITANSVKRETNIKYQIQFNQKGKIKSALL